jgi:hypothetical protein
VRRRLAALAIALLALGCQPSASASFQADGACVADGRATGTYPGLEAMLPSALNGAPPERIDSGRSCSDDRLSTLKTHGVTDLRYAGATWTRAEGSSTVIAVFTTPPSGPPLDASWLEEFYQTGARASTKTENIEISHPSYAATGAVYQLNTLNDLSFQSVVVWPGEGLVHVVIVATELRPGGQTRADHDSAVEAAVAVAAAGSAAGGTGPTGSG